MKHFFIVLAAKLLASALSVVAVYTTHSFLQWEIKEPNWELARLVFVLAFVCTFFMGKNSEGNDD